MTAEEEIEIEEAVEQEHFARVRLRDAEARLADLLAERNEL